MTARSVAHHPLYYQEHPPSGAVYNHDESQSTMKVRNVSVVTDRTFSNRQTKLKDLCTEAGLPLHSYGSSEEKGAVDEMLKRVGTGPAVFLKMLPMLLQTHNTMIEALAARHVDGTDVVVLEVFFPSVSVVDAALQSRYSIESILWSIKDRNHDVLDAVDQTVLQSGTVFLSKWLPQSAVLRHPSISMAILYTLWAWWIK